jgi:ribosomal protein S25
MSATQAVKELIENQLDAIETEVASLHDALRRLDSNGTAGAAREEERQQDKATRRRPPGSRRPTSRPRDQGAGAAPSSLQRLVAEHDALTTSMIAERAGLSRDQALALLKELETRGEVRRTGQRRGVRWHAITDEDRIRARAAELEQLAKPS